MRADQPDSELRHLLRTYKTLPSLKVVLIVDRHFLLPTHIIQAFCKIVNVQNAKNDRFSRIFYQLTHSGKNIQLLFVDIHNKFYAYHVTQFSTKHFVKGYQNILLFFIQIGSI